MTLYDAIIEETAKTIAAEPVRRYEGDRVKPWPLKENSEFIMQREAALEIGGAGMPSVNYTCVTTSGSVETDEIIVCGKDIAELDGDTAFARIILLEVNDLKETEDQEKAFQAIRNLEFVRYHVFPAGYMVRVSSQSNQEQVRISKKARKAGIGFARVGAAYISKYKAVPEVKHVRVIFVTDRQVVETLRPNADKVDAITRTLTHILDGMPTDCGHCSMKPVCDEVDGMRDLHLKGRKKA